MPTTIDDLAAEVDSQEKRITNTQEGVQYAAKYGEALNRLDADRSTSLQNEDRNAHHALAQARRRLDAAREEVAHCEANVEAVIRQRAAWRQGRM